MTATVFVLVGSLLTIAAVFWLAIRSGDSDRRERLLHGAAFLGGVLGLLGAFLAGQQQAAFEAEIRGRLEATLDSVVGGDSFGYLVVMGLSPEADEYMLAVLHEGN